MQEDKKSASAIQWHILRVKPNFERKIGKALQEAGFEVCVPVQKQLKQRSDRQTWVNVVLFNCYVFVATTRKQRKNVFIDKHIFSYLQDEGKPAILKEKDIELIKKLASLPEEVEIVQESFEVGQAVEIMEGELMGYRGEVQSIGHGTKPKVHIAIDVLGCFANVEVPSIALRKVRIGRKKNKKNTL
jgi:transcription antitermination factor NusG